MIKRDEVTIPNSCLNKASDSEMLFILMARDSAAPATIRFWISERIRLGKNTWDDPQIIEAEACASAMVQQDKAKRKVIMPTINLDGTYKVLAGTLDGHPLAVNPERLSVIVANSVLIVRFGRFEVASRNLSYDDVGNCDASHMDGSDCQLGIYRVNGDGTLEIALAGAQGLPRPNDYNPNGSTTYFKVQKE